MEAVPLVQQHALRALEDHRAAAQQRRQEVLVRRSAPRAAKARKASTQSSTGGASSGPSSSVSRSRSARRAGGAAGPGRAVADPRRVVGWPARTRAVSPMPMPHDPCRAAPRASSRARLAAAWYGVVSSASRSTVSRSSASGTPSAAQVRGLGGQRERVHQHEPGQVGGHAGVNVPGAELGERVVPPVGGDDVVRRLRAAVEADHRVDRLPAVAGAEPVDDGALAGVAEAEVDDDDVTGRHEGSRRSSQPRDVAVGRVAPVRGRSGAPETRDGAPPARPAGQRPGDRSRRRRSRSRAGGPGPASRSMASSPRPTVSAIVSQTASRSSSSMTFWPSSPRQKSSTAGVADVRRRPPGRM